MVKSIKNLPTFLLDKQTRNSKRVDKLTSWLLVICIASKNITFSNELRIFLILYFESWRKIHFRYGKIFISLNFCKMRCSVAFIQSLYFSNCRIKSFEKTFLIINNLIKNKMNQIGEIYQISIKLKIEPTTPYQNKIGVHSNYRKSK